jgi:hypothetical protein
VADVSVYGHATLRQPPSFGFHQNREHADVLDNMALTKSREKSMNATRLTSALAMACGLLMLANAAHAANQVTGTVRTTQTVAGAAGAPGNGDFRVWLNNVPSICPGATDETFAFINSTDPDFKAVVAAVTMAYAMGKQLTIYTVPGPISTGTYCQIGWVMVNG